MATQAKRDYYEILGVTRTASEQEIKSSYRKLAMQYHPDRNPDNPNAEEKFKEASEAYSVLIDSEKRARYDKFGHAGVGNGGFGGFDPNAFTDFSDIFSSFGGISDFLSSILGVNVGVGSRHRGQKGRDIGAEVTLAFEEAAFGKQTSIKFKRYELCSHCRGSGAAPGKGPVTCSTCGGGGRVRYQQRGYYSVAACPKCHGTGQLIGDPCHHCSGKGLQMQECMQDVTIPPGIEDGIQLRYSGRGNAGIDGGPDGDLYIVLHVKPHPFFEREGKDLFCSIPLSISQAALGAEITIPVLDGEYKLKIPEGIQSGTVLRIRGKGLASLRGGGKGDLHVQARVQTPTKLTKRQRELLAELGGTFAIENKPEPRSLFEKVKEIFG